MISATASGHVLALLLKSAAPLDGAFKEFCAPVR